MVGVTITGVVESSSEAIASFWTGKSLTIKAGFYLGVGEPSSGNTGPRPHVVYCQTGCGI